MNSCTIERSGLVNESREPRERSASSKATRTSRSAERTSSSDRAPRPRSLSNTPLRRSLRLSNIQIPHDGRAKTNKSPAGETSPASVHPWTRPIMCVVRPRRPYDARAWRSRFGLPPAAAPARPPPGRSPGPRRRGWIGGSGARRDRGAAIRSGTRRGDVGLISLRTDASLLEQLLKACGRLG